MILKYNMLVFNDINRHVGNSQSIICPVTVMHIKPLLGYKSHSTFRTDHDPRKEKKNSIKHIILFLDRYISVQIQF